MSTFRAAFSICLGRLIALVIVGAVWVVLLMAAAVAFKGLAMLLTWLLAPL